MKTFRVLPHTADIRLQLEGDGLEELFAAGVESLASILKPGACDAIRYNKKETISIKAVDITALLVDFLSEILTRSCTEQAVYCRVTFKKLSESKLTAILEGVSVEGFDEDIKAVTHHEAHVTKKSDQGVFEATLVLDI